MPDSARALQTAGVVGFGTRPHVPYVGSTLWILVLVAVEAASFESDDWVETRPLAGAAIACNVAAYTFQSIDYVFYHFEFWPVTALNWTAQLSAIGIASAATAYAFVDRDAMLGIALAHLVAQSLFTASQFAVTLEFFKRSLPSRGAATGAARPAAPVSRGLPRGRFIA